MVNDLPNLDHLDDLDRGMQPPPEPPAPSDTETRARCLIVFRSIPGLTTGDRVHLMGIQ
jgi:hypothetical protein